MNLKRLVPAAVKTKIRLWQRLFNDRLDGTHAVFAKMDGAPVVFEHFIGLEQEIKRTYLFENKLSNIKLSCGRINQVVIKPGEVFSFWATIGSPSSANGFKAGRNIISGKLSESIGGGLCQTSSIVFHLSLIAGLKIIERFNHTIDIYTDETRFTPLGADATVVYGHKDLRVKNMYDFPIKFFLEIRGNQLIAKLFSEKRIKERAVFFKKNEQAGFTEVVAVDGGGVVLARSIYQKGQG